ncbi:MAG: hypothetical protein OXF42_03840, partial [Candidatus Dadabacteria bacterium]|nr:hypothetical protein [Candidatus Dadabacteria bacterium]
IGAIAIGRNAIATGTDAIAIGRNVRADHNATKGGQIRIGHEGQTDVRIGNYDLSRFLIGDPSPPRRPDAPRPPIQSGISDASVKGAEAKADPVDFAPAGIRTRTSSGSINGGHLSHTSGTDATALGYNARVRASGGTAIGANASSSGGIAIGSGVVGGAGIHIGRETSVNAIIGNFNLNAMRTETRDNTREIASLRSDISSFNTGLREANEKFNKGIAMAMAQEFISVDKEKRARFGLTSSGYSGEFGIGASFGVRVNEQIQVHFSGAADTGFDEKGFKTGIDFQF